VESGVTHNGAVQIAYETFGSPDGKPLVLISGLDGQMIGWPDGFCEALVEAGFQVVRYDQRDSGLSTHFAGKNRAYEFKDMVDDLIAVLDAMGWESANLVGLSAGGGLAQFAALMYPDRVRTITAISAIPQYGNPALLLRFVRFPGPFKLVFRRYGDTPEDKTQMLIDITKLTEARSLPLDPEWVTQTAKEAVRRHSPEPHTRTRQLAAGRAAKLPPGGIAKISQPVLAINGDEDALIRTVAGRKLAEAVQNGRFVVVQQMGHLFSPPLWPQLVSEITKHAS
jgi:pimeloyl-ACP methyl ester carboxylesterase